MTKSSKYIKEICVYIDGCSKGNPGPAAIGIIITNNEEEIIKRYKKYIGEVTNQTAEYLALEKALDLAISFTTNKVMIFSDSKLVIKQMRKEFRIKAPHLLEIHKRIRNAERMFKEVIYTYASRESELVKEADKLSDLAIRRLKIKTKTKK
jgi:ribonuclease HI